MVNIGLQIKEKLLEQGKTIVWFSRQLGCSRTNVYKMLSKNSLDTMELMRVCRILNYNFFELYMDEYLQSCETDTKK